MTHSKSMNDRDFGDLSLAFSIWPLLLTVFAGLGCGAACLLLPGVGIFFLYLLVLGIVFVSPFLCVLGVLFGVLHMACEGRPVHCGGLLLGAAGLALWLATVGRWWILA